MSKISVFKFNINNNKSINILNNIIGEYLRTRGFFYNQEKGCYTTGTPTSQDYSKNIAKNVGLAVASAALTGGTRVVGVTLIQKGFEVQINGNQLIIKAYLINNKINSKQHIHSTFNNSNAATYYYVDLKNNLFKILEKNGITYVGKEIEKINDGTEQKTAKILLIIYGILAAVILLPFILSLLTK